MNEAASIPMADRAVPAAADARVLLVTGPAGAGLTTALAALEDLGFETIDNMPISLVPRLRPAERPIALGLDGRGREFSAEAVMALRAEMEGRGESAELLFVDCDATILSRRFAETRRRHPLAPTEDVLTGISRDAALLAPLREAAEALIDTSEMSVHDLRAEIGRLYAPLGQGLAVTVTSFSYRRGIPRGVDLVIDCRVLPNPHWVPDLRALDGRDPGVAAHALCGPEFDALGAHVDGLVALMLRSAESTGRAHLGIGFGCTGGQHRSVAMTERLASALAGEGWRVSKRHRELERHVATGAPSGASGSAGRGA